MKAKLTITIDEDLIPQAKRYAKRQGISLSRLIEQSLRQAKSPEERETFSKRWRGLFRPASRRSERYRQLAEKYL